MWQIRNIVWKKPYIAYYMVYRCHTSKEFCRMSSAAYNIIRCFLWLIMIFNLTHLFSQKSNITCNFISFYIGGLHVSLKSHPKLFVGVLCLGTDLSLPSWYQSNGEMYSPTEIERNHISRYVGMIWCPWWKTNLRICGWTVDMLYAI